VPKLTVFKETQRISCIFETVHVFPGASLHADSDANVKREDRAMLTTDILPDFFNVTPPLFHSRGHEAFPLPASTAPHEAMLGWAEDAGTSTPNPNTQGPDSRLFAPITRRKTKNHGLDSGISKRDAARSGHQSTSNTR
jgi:hypothetical protein